MVLNVLHLSDFHFSGSESYDAELVKTSLLKHIEKRAAETAVSGIFVTGDIANTGRAEELARATLFFDRMLDVAKLPKDALFIVPGNHDIDRSKLVGLVRTLESQHDADLLFCGPDEIPHIQHGQAAYREWYDSYFAEIDKFQRLSSCSHPRLLRNEDVCLAITSVNSAIFSRDDHDFGKLWISRRALAEAKQATDLLQADLNVLLMHHPLEWLHEAEQSSVRALIMSGFDVVCSGHLHETDYSDTRGPAGSCLRIVAGASYQKAPWPRRAHWLSFTIESVEIEPIRYEETPLPIWTIDPSVFPNDQGYKRTVKISEPEAKTGLPALNTTSQVVPARIMADPDLFRAPNGTPIYIEPRIFDAPQASMAGSENTATARTQDDIARSEANTIIHCPLEHGATQIGRQLTSLLEEAGKTVRFVNADDLPTYDKKIRTYFADLQAGEGNAVLVIDDFFPSRDFRRLKEVHKTGLFSRYLVLARSSPISSTVEIMPEFEGILFEECHLWGLDRPRVREIAETIFHAEAPDSVSAAVDKTYSDLLGLAIPLTPVNAIMYLHILWKENDFQPLDRVNILERYIREVLSVPSDAFAGAFNVKNKIALAAAFVKSLFDDRKTYFDLTDWQNFCRSYSLRTLITFDANSVFRVFESARMFVNVGRVYHVRYGFLYSYFVALSIANRPRELATFASREDYYVVPSVVEAISAASTDNSFLLTNLSEKLEGFVARFYEEYVKESFDPLINALWPDAENEKETLWDPINKEISEGPIEPEKIDAIKGSLIAEARSLDQQVVLRKFTEMEEKLFSTINLLEEALKCSDDVDGQLKVRALHTLYQAYLIILQIGTLLSGILATRRQFRWGGLVFNNESPELDNAEDLIGGFSPWVITSINASLTKMAMEKLGTKKLGSLFMSFALRSDLSEFESTINVCMVIRTKPPGWGGLVERVIKSIDRRQFRLFLVLRTLRRDFREELNQHADREELKRLIALIEAKRSTNSNSPGNRAVGKMLDLLERGNFFDEIEKRKLSEMEGDASLALDSNEAGPI